MVTLDLVYQLVQRFPCGSSAQALKKVDSKILDDGTETHSFHTLLMDLATIARHSCQYRGAGKPRFTMTTTANAKQKRALESLDTIVV